MTHIVHITIIHSKLEICKCFRDICPNLLFAIYEYCIYFERKFMGAHIWSKILLYINEICINLRKLAIPNMLGQPLFGLYENGSNL